MLARKTPPIAFIASPSFPATEVVPEGVRVLETAAQKFGFEVRQDHFDFASCDYYEKHGRMMPEDWKERIGRHDAIFFGAVGWPAKVPDHVSLWGSLILFRREFDQYVNLRPVRLMPGVPSPLANRKPGDIDFWVRLAPATSPSRRRAISIRSANSLPCSSRCTARRRTSPGRASPIRSARSGPAR